MDKIVGIVSAAPTLGNRRDDNFVDRLNNRYTVVVLVASAIIVTASMWVGSAITCWAPVHFTGSHTAFTNSYCWVRNTYYIPWEEQVPRADEDRKMVPYYQWIPFILLGQAILFYLPKVMWNGMNQKVSHTTGKKPDIFTLLLPREHHKTYFCIVPLESGGMSRIHKHRNHRILC